MRQRHTHGRAGTVAGCSGSEGRRSRRTGRFDERNRGRCPSGMQGRRLGRRSLFLGSSRAAGPRAAFPCRKVVTGCRHLGRHLSARLLGSRMRRTFRQGRRTGGRTCRQGMHGKEAFGSQGRSTRKNPRPFDGMDGGIVGQGRVATSVCLSGFTTCGGCVQGRRHLHTHKRNGRQLPHRRRFSIHGVRGEGGR